MFDFHKLIAYQKAKVFNSKVQLLLGEGKIDRIVKDQLKRASLSIVLNIAEGSGRFSKKDRRNFFVIARSSVFECAAICDILAEQDLIPDSMGNELNAQSEEISKMLFAMIKNLSEVET